MTRKVGDAWVWLGLGVTLFIGYRCVVRTLQYLADHIETEDDAQLIPPDGFATAAQINEISTESLKVLATCQNINIRKAATRIFLDRVLSDKEAITQILRDVEHPATSDEDRHRAKNALELFYSEEYTMPRHIRAQLPASLHGRFRPDEELIAFEEGRSELNRFLRDPDISDLPLEDMQELVNFLESHESQLHLTPDEVGEWRALRTRWPGRLAQLQRETLADPEASPNPRRRVNDGTPQEQAQRRRRREAMVLNEGDHPLSQQDIFQRRRTEEGAPRR